MKVTLTRVAQTGTDKANNPIKDKFDNPQVRVGIQTKEHGAEWLSGFFKPGQFTAEAGQTIELDVFDGKSINTSTGSPYKNFRFPRPDFATKADLQALEVRVSKLEGGATAPEEDEIDVNSITF